MTSYVSAVEMCGMCIVQGFFITNTDISAGEKLLTFAHNGKFNISLLISDTTGTTRQCYFNGNHLDASAKIPAGAYHLSLIYPLAV